MATIDEVVGFWRQAGPDRWFVKDAAFDDTFRARFQANHFAAARREHDDWAASAEGTLGLMILLDQFPRNCFRGTGHMYATDPLARMFARGALRRRRDLEVEPALRVFFYLPLVHSELLEDQDEAVRYSEPLGGEEHRHAVGHRDIIARFGRFPHRNPMLGRETTPDEQAFLDSGGFAG